MPGSVGAMLGRLRRTAWVTGLVVGGATAFVVWQLRPDLLFVDTTATGGDMGAQVWGPAYLRDHLLAHGRLSGWAPDWFGGFPWLTFYFPIPNLFVVLLDVVLPYNVAFKLVTVLGVVALPVAAWAFGRLIDLPSPAPACLAVAALPFLFDTTFPIHGGNITSTMNGEYSYAIGLSLALVFLGVYARGLATGRHRALGAALLATTVVTHVLAAFLALIGIVVFTAMRVDRRRLLRFVLPTGVVAALLAGFWTVPFLLRLPYTTDLGWEKIVDYRKALLPAHATWAVALAGAGVVLAAVQRRRSGLALSALGAASALVFVVAPQSRLWNGRLLPFWMLCLYLMAGYAVAELGLLAGRGWARLLDDPARPHRNPLRLAAQQERVELRFALATPLVALGAAVVLVALPLQALPSWFPLQTDDTSIVPESVRFTFDGYERLDAYPEFRGVVDTMRAVGRTEGCGRALWEHGEELGRFGTSYGLMLLPHLTEGCIGSMKGLFDESAASSPYMLLAESELSRDPSQYHRDLPYRKLDVTKGIEHLRLLGVRYYLAFSDAARAQAKGVPGLRLVASTGPYTVTMANYQWVTTWDVYRVEDSDIVTPLSYEPVVIDGLAEGGRVWLDAAVRWYQDSNRWDVPLAASGPTGWRRVGGADADLPRRAVTPAVVSDIRSDDDSISFDVDRVGSPVLVKVSYFPNWRVSGAAGVWRVTPNHMVVVPTSRHVTLRYGTTPVDLAGWGCTGLGLVGLVLLSRIGTGVRRRRDTEAAEPGPLAGDGARELTPTSVGTPSA